MAKTFKQFMNEQSIFSTGRKPEKDDHEWHDKEIGITKGDVRDTAYREGHRHGSVSKHMDTPGKKKEWGEHFKHYNAGFLAGRNANAKMNKGFDKIMK